MSWGLDWWDDDKKKPLATKVTEAAARYLQKYGHAATTAYVAPDTTTDERLAGLVIVPSPFVRPNHLFITADALEVKQDDH